MVMDVREFMNLERSGVLEDYLNRGLTPTNVAKQ